MPLIDASNRLLASLPPRQKASVLEACRPAALDGGSVLTRSGSAIENVYFVESGFLSVVSGDDERGEIEVGLVGREGMSGSWLAFGREAAPFTIIAQVPTTGLQMDRPAFRAALANYPEFRDGVLAFGQDLTGMLAETCRATARLTIEGRLARWLLMARDRVEADDLAITHDTLSRTLGVRRPGVTVALHVLEGRHMIKNTRGLIRILDRQKLVAMSEGFYGPHEGRRASDGAGFSPAGPSAIPA